MRILALVLLLCTNAFASNVVQAQYKGVIYTLDHQFDIQLENARLEMKIALDLSDKGAINEIVKNQNAMIELVEKLAKNLNVDASKKAHFKSLLVHRLNEFLSKNFIKDVFFVEFIFY